MKYSETFIELNDGVHFIHTGALPPWNTAIIIFSSQQNKDPQGGSHTTAIKTSKRRSHDINGITIC